MNTLTLGSVEIPLTADAHGFTATADLDGETVRVFVTVTPSGPTAVSPARARFATV